MEIRVRTRDWYYKCRLLKFSEALVFRIWKKEATGQGGLLSGVDPTAFTTSDPLRLWIIQMGMIVMMGQLLSLGLGKIRQPKVVAEVLAGIFLGPTAMGRIPGFTEHIFPTRSLPYLSLVANIGICLFLFIVGLKIDVNVITHNARSSLFIALSTMILSFGLGAAISVPLYHNFIGSPVEFTYFMLFTGVSFSITSFPVLCRILTALKLLDTTVGVVVLSAGVCNDVVCWSLLALSVALTNGTYGLTALWILLTCVAFTVFLMWPVRIALLWFARFTGSLEDGPTIFFMIVTVIVLWACAFFTDVVGISAVFGAFLAGVIVPREGALATSLTKKLEDMVIIVFLPLYFTLSGLSTDLGLLNNGITWRFTIAIICLDFVGKFSACTITTRVSGMSWRESSTVGSLMCCKGPVELIILNIGLSTGILTQRVFSMFVLEALVLTFITTPLVSILYPPERRVRALARDVSHRDEDIGDRQSPMTEPWRSRFTVVLDKFDHMSGMLVATQLVLPSPLIPTSQGPDICVNALRLIEMSDSSLDIMKSSAVDTLIHSDLVLGIFRTFGELNDIHVSLSLAVVPYEDVSKTISDHATRHGSELILLQWLPPSFISRDTTEDSCSPHSTRIEPNLFETFSSGPTDTGNLTATIHSQFVRRTLTESNTDVALFIDPGTSLSGTGPESARHIFFPFFGGPDDRLALEFVMQLCINPRISATVVRMSKSGTERVAVQWPPIVRPEEEDSDETRETGYHGMPIQSTVVMPNISYGQTRFESEAADTILWEQYVDSHFSYDIHPSIRVALSRITFSEHSSSMPLYSAIQQASTRKPVLVVVGRSHRLRSDDLTQELENILKERGSVGQDDSRNTIGNAATAFVASGCATAVVVLQAANVSTD
ncbi:Sodium/hydrogen exchanger family-domain-containing protein [Suillus subalutaceus]|uniref:Sodium/hydrogen exchanger family-domain-containing protein n=1 Tax=Suillus subalutaceus TaxID=48586 RepID=UPI001B87A780|nr:Sodium/hydrogen exchanger family-domain-containing protein [Suillus subalutaceus]KAG1852818.1 Sodium/hydrogen exchanger family-domain-containing protein [Suillus subalutaceus]